MRKILFILLVASFFICSISVVASEIIEYQPNIFTDESKIEEDFKHLEMDISDYHQPNYNYEKWYVVAMSEAYVDTESFDIQTYFYIYNPTSPKDYEYWYQDNDDVGEEHFNEITHFNLTYTLSGNLKSNLTKVLNVNYEHHLYKVKGFSYVFTERAEIKINNVQNFMTSGNGFLSESSFNATCIHSKISGFQVELNFNSTLIIDDYTVVKAKVEEDDNFINNWNSFWGNKNTSVLIYFYNFNFPKHIKYDSVEYAKFQYNYLKCNGKEYLEHPEKNTMTIISEEKVVSEYRQGSRTLRVNDYSQELSFPTFYLGNRVTDKQFGTWDFSNEVSKFNYDCSILLDSTYRFYTRKAESSNLGITTYLYDDAEYTTLDQIEMIELHYKNEGVLYKCQVLSKPVDKDNFEEIEAKPSDYNDFQKFLLWFGKTICHWFAPTAMWPDWGYMTLGGVLSGIAVIVFIALLPHIISLLIKLLLLPITIIKKISN